jgi:hypothetical protein
MFRSYMAQSDLTSLLVEIGIDPLVSKALGVPYSLTFYMLNNETFRPNKKCYYFYM